MAVDQETGSSGRPASVRWGIGDAVVGNVVIILAGGIAFTLAVELGGWPADGVRSLTQVALLQVPVWIGLLGAPLWASYTKGRASLRADFGLEARWFDAPLGLGVGLVGQLVLGLAITVLYDLLGIDRDRVGETAQDLTAAADDVVGVVLLVLVVVVAAPVLEELFYRGLWLRAVERRLGRWWAVVSTSVLFGVVHLQLYDLPALIGIGLILALVTVWTGRLGPAIWAHVAFNGTTLVSLLVLQG